MGEVPPALRLAHVPYRAVALEARSSRLCSPSRIARDRLHSRQWHTHPSRVRSEWRPGLRAQATTFPQPRAELSETEILSTFPALPQYLPHPHPDALPC